MKYYTAISYKDASMLYDKRRTVYVKYQSKDYTIREARFNKLISGFSTFKKCIDYLYDVGNVNQIIEYSSIAYEDTDSATDKANMKKKLNSIYGRSCTMQFTQKRFIAMEFVVTLVRCLRKGLLEPNEPLVIASCEQIQCYYKSGDIDKDLYREIIEVLWDLNVLYIFEY